MKLKLALQKYLDFFIAFVKLKCRLKKGVENEAKTFLGVLLNLRPTPSFKLKRNCTLRPQQLVSNNGEQKQEHGDPGECFPAPQFHIWTVRTHKTLDS